MLALSVCRAADAPHSLPPWLVQRMLLHLALATSAGLIPLLGDVLLAAYKPNSRNAALLEEFLRLRGEKNLADAAAGAGAAGAEKVAGGEGTGKGKGKGGKAIAGAGVGEKEKEKAAAAPGAKASPSPPPTATATGTDARPVRPSGSGRSGRWAWRRGSKSGRKDKGDEKGEPGEGESAGARGSRFVEGDVVGGEEGAGGGKAA